MRTTGRRAPGVVVRREELALDLEEVCKAQRGAHSLDVPDEELTREFPNTEALLRGAARTFSKPGKPETQKQNLEPNANPKPLLQKACDPLCRKRVCGSSFLRRHSSARCRLAQGYSEILTIVTKTP